MTSSLSAGRTGSNRPSSRRFDLDRSRYTWENIHRLFIANPPLQQDAGHIFEWMLHNFWNEHAIAIRKEMEHNSPPVGYTLQLLSGQGKP